MVQREARMVAVTLVVAILLYTSIAFMGTPVFWGALVLLILVLAGTYVGSRTGGGSHRPLGGFLCDDCRYDDERYCSRPERPNATECPDYRRP